MSLLLVPLNPKRGIIYALLVLAEAGWLTAISLALVAIAAPPTGWFLAVTSAVAVAILLGWLTDAYQIPLDAARGLGLILAGGVWLFLLKTALYPTVHLWQIGWMGQFFRDMLADGSVRTATAWIGAATGYIWWRGLFLGHTPPELPIARPTLIFGAGGFIVALLLGNLQPALAPSLALVLLFFCCTLLALSLSHTQTIAEYHGDRAMGRWRSRVLNGIAATAGVLVGAIVLGSILSLPVLDSVMGVLAIGLGYLLKPLAAIFIWLVMKLGPLIEALINWLRAIAAAGNDAAIAPTAAPAATSAPIELTPANSQPVWWAKYTIWMWWALAAAMVVWLFYHFTGALRQRYRPRSTENGLATETTSIAEEKSDSDGWFSAGKKRLGEWMKLIRQFGIGRELHAAATIRRIYAALIVLAAQQGLQRAESETPLEFLAVMQAEWQSLAEPLAVITNAYINVHYGQLPENAAGLNAVKQAWETVLSTLEDETQ